VPKLVLHDLHAAPIADLDADHEPWQCAACGEDAVYLLCGVWRERPGSWPPPEVIADPFIEAVHAALGTNFDFTSCDQHIAAWGTPGKVAKMVPVSASTGESVTLRFSMMS
jgi:hypothetical protein